MIQKGAKMVLQAVSARFARLLAAVCVTALSVLTVGAVSARAAESSLTLSYTCTFPVIGSRAVTTTYGQDLPVSVTQGVPNSPSGATADIVVPAVVTKGLNLVGAATISGSAVASQSVANGAARFGGPVTYTVPSMPVPASGAFTMHAAGTFPSVTYPNAGTATISVGDLSQTLTPLNSRGKPTALGTFTVPCTQVPGQNNALGTFPVHAPLTATTTTVDSSANPSVQGQTVTYTATVSPAGGGTVTFNDGSQPINGCKARSLDSNGQATCQVTYATTGSHAITAVYSGDTASAGSTSAPLTQNVVVDRADLKVKLSMPSSADDGAIVTQKVTVTNMGPATANTEVTALNEPSQLAVLDAGGALVRGPLLTWSMPSLATGASVTYTVTVQVGASVHETETVNAGALSITQDPNMFNNFDTEQIRLG
jgi:hypothetical protein